MSVIKTSKYGWYISHEALIKEIYRGINFQLKPELFKILAPYKSPKATKRKSKSNNAGEDEFKKEVQHVEELYSLFYKELELIFSAKPSLEVKNDEALKTANEVYTESGLCPVTNCHGCNFDSPITKKIGNEKFLFPEKCKFYSCDISELSQHLIDCKYDLILLDPPWWNKYIRRKRSHSDQGYNMLYNEQLKEIPLEAYLKNDGLIVVWCTNSFQHLEALCSEIFPKWGVSFVGKWYWVKVTQSGEVVCDFAEPPRKQPFEQIIFGAKSTRSLPNPAGDKLVVSVPSALHSHKPPLSRLLEPYLPPNPECLELFARYLLPHWTSYGNEALRLQHDCLYQEY